MNTEITLETNSNHSLWQIQNQTEWTPNFHKTFKLKFAFAKQIKRIITVLIKFIQELTQISTHSQLNLVIN